MNVVPRLVEHSAAPAAKAWSGVVVGRRAGRTAKERAMGRAMPVRATAVERGRFARREGGEVERPPGMGEDLM